MPTPHDEYHHAWTHHNAVPEFPTPTQARPDAPSVVVVLLDDTGFADLGCYGSEVATPNMDRLATEGLQYTNFNTTTLCSPSRACLLTGRNHHSVGMRMLANVDSGWPSGRGAVRPDAAMLSEILRPAGYNTMAVGKWHLAPMEHTGPAGPYDQWPLGRGFERFYGFMEGATDHFYPELTEDNHRRPPPAEPEAGYHLTTDLIDRAISYLTDQMSNAPQRPFFCYVALGATHAPHQAPEAYLERYRGAYDQGWDTVRADRFHRQIETGVIPPGTQLPPNNPDVPDWSSLDDRQRAVASRLQEAYAGFLTHTDAQIGRLLDFLDLTGRADNTIVVLLSDNGAAMEGGPVGAVSRIRFFNGLDEDPEFNFDKIGTVGGPDGDNHYPKGWAQASNTPGRWYKYHTHSGGIRDPLLIRWPRGISAAGERRTQFHHIIDVAPTLLSLTGVEAPTQVRGVTQMPVHGVDMAYTFDQPDAPTRRRTQYFEMFGNRAIVSDGWKAVSRHFPGADYDDEPWELYHLDRDFSEARDVADEHPEVLRDLIRLWHVEAGRYDVFPLDDRSVELFSQPPPPSSVFNRRTFTYYAGLSHLHNKAAPDTVDRSYTITADVDRDAGDDGVLVVYGNRWSGYGLYVLEDRLVHEYNFCGDITCTVSDIEVPVGRTELQYRFQRTGRLTGLGTLLIDGTECGSDHLARTLSFISLTGMDVGRNAHAPFSDQFDPPFEFGGRLVRLTYELGDDKNTAP